MSYLDNSGVSYLWSKIKAAFAPKSHSHAAGDITSGTLPVARGGTGATTAANARTNLDAAQSDGAEGTLRQVELAAAITALNFAPIEYDGRPSQISHEVGEYILRARGDHYEIRYLYRVTSRIAAGGDINSSNTVQVTAMEEFAFHTHSASDVTSGTFGSDRIPSLDASKIGSGTLSVTHGGTGQSGVSVESVIANIASAGSNCSVTSATFHQWGKVGQLFISIKVSAAKSSGDVLATLVTGKRPVQTTPLMNTANINQFCAAYSNGQIQAKSSLTSGTTVYVVGTYVIQ